MPLEDISTIHTWNDIFKQDFKTHFYLLLIDTKIDELG